VVWLDAQPFCARCGRPYSEDGLCGWCRRAPSALDHIRSAALFGGPLREAVHAFKYKGRVDLAQPLAELMVAFWRRNPLPADVIVPVPLHARRERERGFNQAVLLAQAFAARVELPVTVALERARETVPQVGLNAHERRENVRGAFTALIDMPSGHRALLVDDICTTGATLDACAVALRRAGCRRVYALTLARADFGPEHLVV
jgi:ComF family protein